MSAGLELYEQWAAGVAGLQLRRAGTLIACLIELLLHSLRVLQRWPASPQSRPSSTAATTALQVRTHASFGCSPS